MTRTARSGKARWCGPSPTSWLGGPPIAAPAWSSILRERLPRKCIATRQGAHHGQTHRDRVRDARRSGAGAWRAGRRPRRRLRSRRVAGAGRSVEEFTADTPTGAPTVPTLLRLLRAAGFDLRMHLAPLESHDQVLNDLEDGRTHSERRLRDRQLQAWRRAVPVEEPSRVER